MTYHSIDNNKTRDSTDITLFDREMKYLHDNGFKVLTVNDLGYDTKSNFLYIKPSVAQLTAANPVNLTRFHSISVIGMNGYGPKQSAIIRSNTSAAPLSSNISSSLFYQTPLINHLSVPTNSSSSASIGSSGPHQSIHGKDHFNGKNSKHHGSYCNYSDYKSNVCR